MARRTERALASGASPVGRRQKLCREQVGRRRRLCVE
jgi:hypothetical protein